MRVSIRLSRRDRTSLKDETYNGKILDGEVSQEILGRHQGLERLDLEH